MSLSDLNLAWPQIIGLSLAFALLLWYVNSKLSYVTADSIRVQRKSRLLTMTERKLFDALSAGLSREYLVFPKVRIMDVIDAKPGTRGLELRRINRELVGHHFDYAVCRRDDMSIIAVIELESSTRQKRDRKRKLRDKLLNRVCKSASLKLFYFDARQDYKNTNFERIITGKRTDLAKPSQASVPVSRTPEVKDERSFSLMGGIKTCPKCRGEVITKIAVKGRNIGEKFLMCRKYPYCDYRVSKKELNNINQLKAEAAPSTSTGGYKNWSNG